ncbi:MAG TPA: tetratricopeptide repeat protein [Holophagaceae bacterium]|nr:tetratricopeptide repeat protein [Holophagaceae bacterium]
MRTAALCATLLAPLVAQAPTAPDPKAQALAWAEQARTLKPKQAKVLLDVGRTHLAAGDLPKAEEAFARVEALEPRDADLQVQVALAWLRGGQGARVLPKVPELRDRFAGEPEALAAFAEGLSDLGHLAEARVVMITLAQKHPKAWEAFVRYGRACIRGQRREEAAEWFERAVAVKPKNSDIWRAIALAHADQGANPEEVR